MRLSTIVQEARHRVREDINRFDRDQVEKLRKDFLTLMKNVDKVQNYDQCRIFADAMRTWTNHFDETTTHLVNGIPHVVKAIKGFNDHQTEEHWKKVINQGVWDLHIDAQPPLERAESVLKHHGLTSLDRAKEYAFHQYQERKTKWGNKVKESARKAWATLKKYLDWTGLNSTHALTDKPEMVQMSIEGFQVQLHGMDTDNGHPRQFIPLAHAALKLYRDRASKVFPWLIQNALPIMFHGDCDLNLGGRYENRYIKVCLLADRTPGGIAHIIAHEMGHHVWRVFLSGQAQKFWEAAVAHDRGDLDLRYLLSLWPPEMGLYAFHSLLLKKDPRLYLQVEAVMSRYSGAMGPAFRDREDVQELVDRGVFKVSVPNNPITAYAEKSGEEAFCETMGLLVGRGPNALPALVKSWLHVILPSVRAESR